MKKRFLHKLLPLALSLTLAFSACGQEAASDAVSSTTEVSGEASTEAPSDTTITETPARDSTEASATPTNAPAESTPAPTEEPAEEIDWYQQMLNTSILSTGTNGRLNKVIEKLASGQEVSIAMIGGSITEGAGADVPANSYGDLFVAGLQETYPEATIHYCNAGLGNTPSTLGLMRYDRDVTDKAVAEPDLVIIEFAVNDWDEPTYGRAYESMVRNVLEQENEAAVLLLFSVFQSKWNMQDDYSPIGELYGLPMVSMSDAIAYAYEENQLDDTLYFADIYHPTNYGHQITADCLTELFERVAAQGTVEIAPLTEDYCYSPDFRNMHFVTAADSDGATISVGGFSETDTALQNFSRTNTPAFPDNWMHTAQSGDESFKAELTCKNIMLNYKISGSGDFGFASVYVDGELVTELFGFEKGGWNSSLTELILDEAEAAPHTLEIKMSEGWEDCQFTILGIGYSD